MTRKTIVLVKKNARRARNRFKKQKQKRGAVWCRGAGGVVRCALAFFSAGGCSVKSCDRKSVAGGWQRGTTIRHDDDDLRGRKPQPVGTKGSSFTSS